MVETNHKVSFNCSKELVYELVEILGRIQTFTNANLEVVVKVDKKKIVIKKDNRMSNLIIAGRTIEQWKDSKDLE